MVKLEEGNYFQKNGIWKSITIMVSYGKKVTTKINIKHGPAQFFYQDGIGNDENWNNGQDGIWKMYYPNGKDENKDF